MLSTRHAPRARAVSASESDQINLSFAGQAFGGYDFWIGPEWSIGLQGALSFTTAAKLQEQQSGSSVSTGYTVGSFGGTIGVALVYH